MKPRTIAIGDVHGCSRALEALLTAIAPRPTDLIVTLGDYVNRGPDSRGVIDRLIALEGQCTLVPLLGNHDQTFLAALNGDRRGLSICSTWAGVCTLASYGAGRVTEADLSRVPAEHVAFLRRCRAVPRDRTHIFVHAQYEPDLPMDEQSALWLRLGVPPKREPGPARLGQDGDRRPLVAERRRDPRPRPPDLHRYLLLRRRLAHGPGGPYG